MARRRVNTTKYEIIQTGTHLFLEKGYSHTTPKLICEALDISTGNLTYYFPTKEHLLSVLVEMLCNYQGQVMNNMVREEGKTSILALCLELATMTAMSENDPIARDLFVSAYSSPISLDIIRKNDARRAKHIFHQFCPDWTDQQYAEAEILVSGIEYATLMTTDFSVPIQIRISGALESILRIYNVPENIRKQKIECVLSIDYKDLGTHILQNFKQYVTDTTEQAFGGLADTDHSRR